MNVSKLGRRISALCSVALMAATVTNAQQVKNIIVLVPDGCNEAVQTVARWYKGSALALDSIHTGDVAVHMANSVIPGSGACATAFASGHKTSVKFIGVGPRTDDLLTGLEPTAPPYAPLATVLEAAKSKGKSTGLISTSRITHATPAAFAAHIHSRGLENELMEHMVYNNLDLAFGGGLRHLIPEGESYTTSFGESWSGKRKDGQNLLQVLEDREYQVVDSKDDMQDLTSGKAWGMFASSHMRADLDRTRFAPTEPSIAEMTRKAIELLSKDDDGFFLMVEGSQVDWAGHANDPIYMVTDFLAFDDAVKEALDFAEEDGNTLVLAYPDHNTGGMAIGQYRNDSYYTAIPIEDLIDPLKEMKITAGALASLIGNDPTHNAIKENVTTEWGIDLTDSDCEEILELEPTVGLGYALARVISKNYTIIGWTTHQHNAETVPLWAYGPGAPVGLFDNTDLARIKASAFGVDLDDLTDELYMDVSQLTDDFTIDTTTPGDWFLQLGDDKRIALNKDYMELNGSKIMLPSLSVYSPMTNKAYISEEAHNPPSVPVNSSDGGTAFEDPGFNGSQYDPLYKRSRK
ncbi:MAG: alkaline phosphatase [Fibrobacterota bacterium]